MKKLHVFDIDGTILTSDHLYRVLKTKVYNGLTKKNFKYYNIEDSLRYAGMKNPPKNSDIFKVHGTDILMGSEMDQTFLEFFEQEIENKTDFIFLTARNSNQHFITEHNFKNTVLENYLKSVYYTGDQKINTEEGKLNFVKGLGFQETDIVLYEDRTATANLFAEKGSSVFLVNQPYNVQKETKEGVTRIDNYEGLILDFKK